MRVAVVAELALACVPHGVCCGTPGMGEIVAHNITIEATRGVSTMCVNKHGESGHDSGHYCAVAP